MTDGSIRREEVPIDDYPFAIALLELPVCRFMRGLPPDGGGKIADASIWTYPDKLDLDHLLEKFGAVSCNIDFLVFEILQFSQFLAKMAHGWAVAYMPQNYIPLAPDLILGRECDPNYIVGSKFNLDLGPVVPGTYFQISAQRQPDFGVVAVFIRLLPSWNAPTYHVVVGRSPGGPSLGPLGSIERSV